MVPPPFQPILEEALCRHGSAALEARLTRPKTAAELRAVGDDRYLSAMSRRIFQAGLKHSLVDAKWPAFEEVFAGFDPSSCAALGDERIEEMLADRRLVRHLGKLRAVRANAAAMREIAAAHGSFAAWLADWPEDDPAGLQEQIAKRFAHMGGNSAAVFLRSVGRDTYILTDAVVRALNRFGAFDGSPRSRADRRAVQDRFVAWKAETGRPFCQLSQILAMSVD